MNGVRDDLFSIDDSPDAIIYSYFGSICTLMLLDAASLSREYYGLGMRNHASYHGALLQTPFEPVQTEMGIYYST